MVDERPDKLKRPAGTGPNRVSPAEGEDWYEIGEDHQQNEGDDVVRNRADRLAKGLNHIQAPILGIVAGQGAEQVAKNP